MKHKRVILWLRNDLRLHDQEALWRASQQAEVVLPIYCFDPRHERTTVLGLEKMSPFRRRFLIESLEQLREGFQALGSDLFIRHGKPEEVIPELVKSWDAEAVYAHQEVGTEEEQVEHRLEQNLFKLGLPLNLYWGSSLYHREDLPMPMHALPESYTPFRKRVEKYVDIRKTFSIPERLRLPQGLSRGSLPEKPGLQGSNKGVLPFFGGEQVALTRLKHYLWDTDALATYKETRNGLLGADYSSKFSPWLALGCLSPRKVYEEVKAYEAQRKKNSSTYWLIFELIWRDYFRFIAHKHGRNLFLGLQELMVPSAMSDIELSGEAMIRWQAWTKGETGYPFIDANMRELNQTGFMSNRGRQNVASFLVHDMGIDWRLGASYFEAKLIDYDVASNWGNWNYLGGVGNDPRKDRYFNILGQAKRYDAKGAYIAHWISALKKLPPSMRHEPFSFPTEQLISFGFNLGQDYPAPIASLRGNSRKLPV
ncbi:MAG: DASH family cryptochrome [Bacteroidota bacterium]